MSMSITEFLADLRESQIKLFYTDGQLKVKAPEGKLPLPLVDELKQRKQEIIDYLQEKPGDLPFQNIQPVEEREYYDMSHAQERFWVLHQFEEAKTMGNMPGMFILEGELDIPTLNNAFRALIRRHEILRTGFISVNGIPKQVIRKQIDFAVGLHHIEEKDSGKRDRLIKHTVEQHAKIVYDLSRAPLFNVDIIKPPGTSSSYIFLFNMHHIISDGWSLPIFFKQLSLFYNAGLPAFHRRHNQKPGEPEPLRIRYKDFVHWQNTYISSSASAKKQKLYWQKEFSGQLPLLNFPTDFPRPAVKTYGGDFLEETLEPTLTAAIKEIGKKYELTLFVFLNAAVNILIYRYTGQQDIIIGTPTAGRDHPDLENQIGCYINTLALRTRVKGKESFEQYCRQVKQTTTRSQDNQMYPFDRLVDDLNLQRDTSRHPLFDIMVAVQNTEPIEVTFENALVTPQKKPFKTSKFDLTFNFTPQDEKILIQIDYNIDLYKQDRIRQLARHFTQLVNSITQNPDQAIDRLNLLNQKEIHQLLIEFNETGVDYPGDKTLMDLFADQVEQTPDRIALIGEGTRGLAPLSDLVIQMTEIQNPKQEGTRGLAPLSDLVSITYRELHKKSHQLAYVLGKKGVGPDTIVGIMADRSLETITGILAILKAGGTYLPIDPDYPQARIAYMLKDSNAKILVTNPYLLKKFEKLLIFNCQLSIVNCQWEKIPYSHLHLSPAPATSLAYIIYTSGSTGGPKGVMVNHYSVVNLVYSQAREFGIDETDRILQFSTLCFDASVEQVFTSLTRGAVLVLIDKDTLMGKDKFHFFLNCLCVTHLHAVPSFLTGTRLEALPGIRRIIAGGDTCPVSLAAALCGTNDFYNEYGPTETTVTSIQLKVSPGLVLQPPARLPIGKPIANTVVYILDRVMYPVPLGAVGELIISGDGVARGYLNQPELTAEKFDHDSWDLWDYHDGYHKSYRSYKSYILYKTGDLARWLVDGNIEFLGRKDRQVKIRGFRIELAEIEHRLSRHPGVKEAVVIAGNGELTAYVVNNPGSNVNPGKYLQEILPNYMVPTQFVQLERLPLTPSGKVDGKALSQLAKDGRQLAGSSEYIPPGSETEKKLAEIWLEVLKKEKISLHDNFFHIGGHSLKAAQLVSRINRDMKVNLQLRDIFKFPTLAAIANLISQKEQTYFQDIHPGEKREYYAVSHAQRRLWLLSQFKEARISYNMPLAALFKGQLDIDALTRAFQALIRRHDSLRTGIMTVSGVPHQRVHQRDEVEFKINRVSCPVESRGAARRQWLQKISRQHAEIVFDLTRAPLFSVQLVELSRQENILLINMHHIISDGWSTTIFFNELFKLYQAAAAIAPGTRQEWQNQHLLRLLPPLQIQYKDYTLWQNTYIFSGSARDQKAYWHKKLRGERSVLNFPTDYPRPLVKKYNGDIQHLVMDTQVTEGLNRLCRERGLTLFMGLSAAVNLLIHSYTGQEDIIIGTPTAGRNHPRLENQVGCFVNTLALRCRVNGNEPVESFLQQVRQVFIEALNRQIYPFDRLVDELNLHHDTGRHPLFDIVVVLQNTGTIELPFAAGTSAGFELNPGHLKITTFESPFKTSKFDLTFNFAQRGSQVLTVLEYNTDLFKPARILRLRDHFIELVKDMTANPGQAVRDINILTPKEKHQLLIEFNDSAANYPREKTIHRLFAEQVRRTPDSTVLVAPSGRRGTPGLLENFDGMHLSYGELNEKSHQLAGVLRRKGVKSDTVVSIMVERSIEMIIGLLGILKSGGAYLPIDPEYPEERIDYMLKDSGTAVLLTDGHDFNCQLSIANCQLSMIDEMPSLHPHLQPAPATSLAYIIYTSGSTGRPKGVMVNHSNVVRLFFNDKFMFDFSSSDIWTMFHSYCFDFSVWEIFGALLFGGRLVVIGKMTARDPAKYLHLLVNQGVTVLNQTPSAFFNLQAEELKQPVQRLSLRYVIFGGEALKPARLKDFHARYPRVRLINMYGITETTVHVTYKWVTGSTVEEERSNIGKPIPTLCIYVVDEVFRLVPLGVPGELAVSGAGLARGYLNNPGLTAEKFDYDFWDNQDDRDEEKEVTGKKFNKKFLQGGPGGAVFSKSALPGRRRQKIYKTGDLGKRLENGDLEYLGRKDKQVQIRGFRVEPGEIEARIRDYDGVKEVVITPNEDETGSTYLSAYIVGTDGREVDLSRMREYFSRRLPAYMLPTYIMKIDNIPLTPQGKLDLKSLPGFEIHPASRLVPRTETEIKLAGIWQRHLGLEGIGTNDNYFNIGGDSIKAIGLINSINKEFNSHLEIVDIYLNDTIGQLARRINRETPRLDDPGLQRVRREIEALKTRIMAQIQEPDAIEDLYPMSDIEKGMIYHWKKDLDDAIYHDQAVRLFSDNEFDLKRFRQAFLLMVEKHAILRTGFNLEDYEELVQIVYHPSRVKIDIQHRDISHFEKSRRDAYIKDALVRDREKPIDIARPSLTRIQLFEIGDGNVIMVFSAHHAVLDGWSDASLVTELYNTYARLKSEPQYKPVKLKSTYKEYVIRELAEKKKSHIIDYWKNELEGCTRLKFPGVTTGSGGKSLVSNKKFQLDLGTSMLEELRKVARKYQTSVKNICFAAYLYMLGMLSYEKDLVVALIVNNRPPCEDGDKLWGCFLNSLPVRMKIPGNIHWFEYIRMVDKKLLELEKFKKLSFFEILRQIHEKSQDGNPLFDTLFNFVDFHVYHQVNPEMTRVQSPGDISLEGYIRTNTLFDFSIDTTFGDFVILLFYSDELIGDIGAEKFSRWFSNVLNKFIHEPGGMANTGELLSAEEKRQLLVEFNDTKSEYPKSKTIVDLFAEQVERTPDHIAVVFWEQQLSYKALDEEANQLAHYLYHENGVIADQPVGILMDRCPAMIVAVIGILKAGGAYVPISPLYPEERIKHMMDDADINILIGQKRYIKTLNRLQWECRNLDTFLCIDSEEVLNEEEAEENELMSRKLWEYVGETAVDEISGGGWNSSFTGNHLSKEEMDEYGDNILKKLEPLLHKNMRVLEIGAASGISMFRIAPRVGLYYGTDLSRAIIEKNRQRVKKEGHRNIKLHCLAAHEIQRLEERDFDLVIFNSVIQCFNGHNYLKKVLRKVIHLMRNGPNGYIFLGDLMDQEMKNDLIKELMRFKQANKGKKYKTKTDWSQELFISRSFLEDLVWDYPEIHDMEFSGKIHTIKNELTEFRYDALVYIDKTGKSTKKQWERHKRQHDLNALRKYGSEKIKVDLTPGNLAYIIYTSGSTGIPKGVMASHKNVVRLVKNSNFIRLKKGDKILQTGALEFDASTFEIWGVLLNGLTLVLESKNNLLVPGILKESIKRNKITTIWMTSTLFNRMLDADIDIFTGLKNLLVGGEVLSPSHINRLRNRCRGLNIINGYGPTENVTFSTTFLIDKGYENSIPIGTPIANSSAYIVDRYCNLVPTGVRGELCVGGDGVARGYLNNTILTAEKFIENPFVKNDRLYRTGDYVRWLADGNIEFLGRIDSQVKIRGFRIELGEIENQLLNIPSVKEAVVIEKTDSTGDKCLSAYIVSDEAIELTELKGILSKNLPEYMIPSFITRIEKIPLTSSGKIDRQKLPEPVIAGGAYYLSPGNEIEQRLALAWSEVLGIDKELIGINDNFFEIGGNSLKILRITAKITREFGENIPIAKMFEYPTIHSFAEFLSGRHKEKFDKDVDETKSKNKKWVKLNERKKRVKRNGK